MRLGRVRHALALRKGPCVVRPDLGRVGELHHLLGGRLVEQAAKGALGEAHGQVGEVRLCLQADEDLLRVLLELQLQPRVREGARDEIARVVRVVGNDDISHVVGGEEDLRLGRREGGRRLEQHREREGRRVLQAEAPRLRGHRRGLVARLVGVPVLEDGGGRLDERLDEGARGHRLVQRLGLALAALHLRRAHKLLHALARSLRERLDCEDARGTRLDDRLIGRDAEGGNGHLHLGIGVLLVLGRWDGHLVDPREHLRPAALVLERELLLEDARREALPKGDARHVARRRDRRANARRHERDHDLRRVLDLQDQVVGRLDGVVRVCSEQELALLAGRHDELLLGECEGTITPAEQCLEDGGDERLVVEAEAARHVGEHGRLAPVELGLREHHLGPDGCRIELHLEGRLLEAHDAHVERQRHRAEPASGEADNHVHLPLGRDLAIVRRHLMLANRLEHRRLVDDFKLGRQMRRVEDGERQRVGVVDEGVAIIERIGRGLDAGREASSRNGEREQRIAHRLDVDEHRQIVLGDRRGDKVEAEWLLAMRQDDARARLHIELIVLLPVLIRDAQPEAHRDLGGVGQREVHAVQEAERHIAKVDALFGRVVEVERRRDHAPFEDERQRVGLPVQLPHEGLIKLAQQIGEEAHLDHLLLA